MAAIAAADDEAPEWDSHGLPPNAIVHLTDLTSSKKYKISDIQYFDRRRWETLGTEEVEMLTLVKGEVYTKAQLQKELQTLTTILVLEEVNLELKAKTDGTLAVKIHFTGETWPSPKKFRCINAGPILKLKQIEMDSDIMEKEVSENLRPCLLPRSVHREILQMVREQEKLSGRILLKIQDRVNMWYHDNGYECATVTSFGNLDQEEMVCEIAEGVITGIVIQFIDELGNVCKGNTQLSDVRKAILDQLREGHVFNIKAGTQALKNISSLGLFSIIEMQPRIDEKNIGGIILEIKLRELEQKFVEESSVERTQNPDVVITQDGVVITQDDVGDNDEKEPLDEHYDDDDNDNDEDEDEADPRFDGNNSIWFWLHLILASFSWTV